MMTGRYIRIVAVVTLALGLTDAARLLGVTTGSASPLAALGPTGRVLIRPSGTEPLVRVMVEAPGADQADSICERLAAVVRRELGA